MTNFKRYYEQSHAQFVPGLIIVGRNQGILGMEESEIEQRRLAMEHLWIAIRSQVCQLWRISYIKTGA